MATRASTIDYLLDQVAGACPLSAKRMFGEFGLYHDDKLVALVCDDQLYLKPTDAVRRFLGAVVEAKPHPTARPSFLIEADTWEDGDRLAMLLGMTAAALPETKPRKVRTGAVKSVPLRRRP